MDDFSSSPAIFSPSDQDMYLSVGPVIVSLGAKTVEIEALTAAGSSEKPNEDAFAVRSFGGTLAVAIFDGATSLRKIPAHDRLGMSGARYASHFLRNEFLKLDRFTENTLADLNRRLKDSVSTWEGLNTQDAVTMPTSTATIALIDPDKDTISIQHIADSFAVTRDTTGEITLHTSDSLSEVEQNLNQKIQEAARTRGITNREARFSVPEIQQELILLLQNSFNRSDGSGIGVVNGSPSMDQYIERHTLPLSSTEALLLGSDGLPAPQEPLTQERYRRFMLELAVSEGLNAVLEHKKKLEDYDSDWNSPRWKHSDDATGILVRFR